MVAVLAVAVAARRVVAALVHRKGALVVVRVAVDAVRGVKAGKGAVARLPLSGVLAPPAAVRNPPAAGAESGESFRRKGRGFYPSFFMTASPPDA